MRIVHDGGAFRQQHAMLAAAVMSGWLRNWGQGSWEGSWDSGGFRIGGQCFRFHFPLDVVGHCLAFSLSSRGVLLAA